MSVQLTQRRMLQPATALRCFVDKALRSKRMCLSEYQGHGGDVDLGSAGRLVHGCSLAPADSGFERLFCCCWSTASLVSSEQVTGPQVAPVIKCLTRSDRRGSRSKRQSARNRQRASPVRDTPARSPAVAIGDQVQGQDALRAKLHAHDHVAGGRESIAVVVVVIGVAGWAWRASRNTARVEGVRYVTGAANPVDAVNANRP
jgi:hypothetical protein